MTVAIRSQEHTDPLARREKHRRRWLSVSRTLVVAIIAGGLSWLVFFSSVFRITQVRIDDSLSASLQSEVQSLIGHNLLLMRTGTLTARIGADFPVLASVSVKKIFPHTLTISAVQRVPIGLWCLAEVCRYFDANGGLWGSPPKSRGALLLMVDDQRLPVGQAGKNTTVDSPLFAGLLEIVDGLPHAGLRVSWVSLPDASPGDVTAHVDAGYDVYFDAYGDVGDQLATLEVFLGQHAKDKTFAPKYLDLRTPERVYFQ